MWPFSKKRTIADSGILAGYTDHHSHILPGVDDGVESMDEALRIIATYEATGVKELWLTPHIMEDIPNTPEKLRARFAELEAAYTGNITLHLAAEYMIDNHLRSLLREVKEVEKESIAEGVKDNNNSPSSKREYPQGEGVEKDSNTENNCPSSGRGTSNAQCIAEGVKDDNNSPSSKREYPQGEGVEKDSNTDNNCPSSGRGTSNAQCIAEGVKDNSSSPTFNEEQHGGALHGKNVQETTSCHFEPKGEISTTKEELLPIGAKHNHLLVETSYFNPPMRLHETLRQIKSLGYHPLLAHPERYMYMDNDEYRALHEEGVKFQLNLPSICGGYGNTVKKRALWLLKEGLYDAIGSDTHCEEGVEFLLEARIKESMLKALQKLLSRTL